MVLYGMFTFENTDTSGKVWLPIFNYHGKKKYCDEWDKLLAYTSTRVGLLLYQL